MTDYRQKALEMHRKAKGKIELKSKIPVETQEDLSIAYTPGVAAPCLAIAEKPELAFEMTIRANTVAVVTDGSAVLGLGNIGPEASLPVMEGKALLFKQYANVDAFPICLNTQDTQEIIETVRRIAPGFGGINLEDIAAPKCFQVEAALQDLGIPVFHDDQHGTAIAVLAGLINAAKAVGRDLSKMRVVIGGAGAAGIAIAKILCGVYPGTTPYVGDVILCDRRGAISTARRDLSDAKRNACEWTNADDVSGTVHDALKGADVFIGVSAAELLTKADIERMAPGPLVFAMANPTPEIRPEVAKAGGAAIVATGRSDYPNQVNNVLVFPGLFRGAMDARVSRITPKMFIAAAHALAATVAEPTVDRILPQIFDPSVDVSLSVAEAVYHVARQDLEGEVVEENLSEASISS